MSNDIETVSVSVSDVLAAKIDSALTPGVSVDFTPEQAETAGAFVEDALSADDALNASDDIA